MAAPSNPDPSIASQLAEYLPKVLKPGGVSVGGLYGLWALAIEQDVAKAIAAALIGFCFSYVGNLLEPLHRGNQRRLELAGRAIEGSVDDYLAHLLAKTTRAEEAYLLCQALDCRDYKTEGMGQRDRTFIPALQEVFVPLALDLSALDDGSLRRRRRSLSPEECANLDIWYLLRQTANEPTYRQLAIVARGGYGKTTLLKHLAYIYGSQQRRPHQVPTLIPILLPLRLYRQQFQQETPPDLPTLIMAHHIRQLAELNPKVRRLPSNWAEEVLRRGRGLVMWDGFDEIPEEERARLVGWLHREMRRFDRSVFILTSRPKAYQESFTEPLRTKVWVQAFNREQQTQFVQQWYLSQERLARGGRNTPEVQRDAQRNAQTLLAQIHNHQRPALADLARNPLLLNLLATYHRSNPGVELPRQRAELYQDICTLQLRKRPEARSVALLLSPGDRQRILQSVALTLMQRTQRLVPEAEMVDLIAQALKDQGHTSLDAQTFLDQIIDVSELILRQGLEGCEFTHLSFQEFLAAAEIKALNQEALLYPLLQGANQPRAAKAKEEEEAWWRDTILLYSAQINPAPLIQEALRQRADRLAYDCYREARYSLEPDIVARLEALKPTLASTRYGQLEAYLQAGEWRKADEETYRLMIATVGKEAGEWFSREELLNFPCEELLAIDGLWVQYSQGKWGFSVQKRIYVECGAKLDGNYPGNKIWHDFCRRVGWRKGESHVSYTDLTFDLQKSLTGEFPSGGRVLWGSRGFVFSSLAQRLVNCTTSQS